MRLLFISSLVVFFISCSTTPQGSNSFSLDKRSCETTRAAFDLGSGSTRVTVAKVDSCKIKILKVLLKKEDKVPFKEDLSKSKNHSFSQDVMNQGLQLLKEFKEEAKSLGAKEFVGVATSAYRDARNGQKYVEQISLELQMSVQILTQSEEASLGFYSVLGDLKVDPQNILVWDIGGGSQQIIKLKSNNQFSIYEGNLASVSFKNFILKRIKRSNSKSPNPMNAYQMNLAIQHAENIAKGSVLREIRNLFIENPSLEVYGIGGVHAISIINQVKPEGGDSYTQEDLEKTIKEKTGLTDQELGMGKYVETDVSNLALVLGFMKGLQMKEVHVVNTNLSDGLLLNSNYWMP